MAKAKKKTTAKASTASAITKTQPDDGNKIKRSVLRVIGLTIITSGFYLFYWFFVTKNQLKRELKNDQHVGWQTVGLVVPILNIFIQYWLYRDINRARATQKLSEFAAVWYVLIPFILMAIAFVIGAGAIFSIIGAIGAGANGQNEAATGLIGASVLSGLFAFLLLAVASILQYLFMGLAISKLNQYWDARTGGKAAEAGWGKGEIAVIVVGIVIMCLNFTNNGDSGKDDYQLNQDQSVGAVSTVRS